jgi:hypothetical protein
MFIRLSLGNIFSRESVFKLLIMEDLDSEQTDKINEFQAISGLENINHSISLLEAADWDLQRAISLLYDAPSPSSEKVGNTDRIPEQAPLTSQSSSSCWTCILSPFRWTLTLLWRVLSLGCKLR